MDNLKYLLSAYFHQDWNHEHDSWQAVVDEFVADDAGTVSAIPGEIDQLLSGTHDDVELGKVLVTLGCAYDPEEGDRKWLGQVRDRIRELLGGP